MKLLSDLLATSVDRNPGALAVAAPDGDRVTYAALDRAAARAARALAGCGVAAGDRVVVWLEKSIPTLAAMQGALRLGAAYVPVDPLHPPERAAALIQDCQAAAVVTTPSGAGSLRASGVTVECLAPNDLDNAAAGPASWHRGGPDDLAYILYTSGTTGQPKGVCLSHRNALAFVNWAADELNAGPTDRFANHAPFHFDLSVLDMYVSFQTGASVHLIPQHHAYAPQRMVSMLAEERITVWYSVPSALILMARHGGLLEVDLPELRAVLFAGEPYPVDHLRRLREHLPSARFLNLYGPTETNVCTFHEVTDLPADQLSQVPIGRECSGDTVWVARPDGTVADSGEEGELLVTGPTVMLGYWGHPPQGPGPYRTGDRAVREADGTLHYLGRQDGLVKVRGHRVELAEIESILEAHASVSQAAAVVGGTGLEARIVAYVVSADASAPNLLELKRHCARFLPRYAVIDVLVTVEELPRTRNGKIDRRSLAARWAPASSG